jgi:hypothetical protein
MITIAYGRPLRGNHATRHSPSPQAVSTLRASVRRMGAFVKDLSIFAACSAAGWAIIFAYGAVA